MDPISTVPTSRKPQSVVGASNVDRILAMPCRSYPTNRAMYPARLVAMILTQASVGSSRVSIIAAWHLFNRLLPNNVLPRRELERTTSNIGAPVQPRHPRAPYSSPLLVVDIKIDSVTLSLRVHWSNACRIYSAPSVDRRQRRSISSIVSYRHDEQTSDDPALVLKTDRYTHIRKILLKLSDYTDPHIKSRFGDFRPLRAGFPISHANEQYRAARSDMNLLG
nr:hypothetical protein CFP56_22392 [Quercus suber]